MKKIALIISVIISVLSTSCNDISSEGHLIALHSVAIQKGDVQLAKNIEVLLLKDYNVVIK